MLRGQDSNSSPPAYKGPGLGGGEQRGEAVKMNLLTRRRDLRWDEGTV